MSGFEFVPPTLPPVERPMLREARVLGNVALEQRVHVMVGGVAVEFWREAAGAWSGGRITTVARGQELDEAWLAAARSVALEALRAAVAKQEGSPEQPSEIVRCPECGRLLCSSELAQQMARARITTILCAPVHVVHFDDRYALALRPDGSAAPIVDGDPEPGSDRDSR